MELNTYAIKLYNPGREILFYQSREELLLGQQVVIETAFGMELGQVASDKHLSKLKPGALPQVYRVAREDDVQCHLKNEEDAKQALRICKEVADRHSLDMQLIVAYYSLPRSKLLFVYTAEERVDFRNLLKDISAIFHTRIELRQIGLRDRSKLIGGIASCGMALCCHTFINDFDGISINMAKNQMLTLNINKLSGQCNKLLCCLKYEDEQYTQIKESLPRLGVKLFYDKKEYRLTSFNVIAETARLDNEDGCVYIDFKTLRELV